MSGAYRSLCPRCGFPREVRKRDIGKLCYDCRYVLTKVEQEAWKGHIRHPELNKPRDKVV